MREMKDSGHETIGLVPSDWTEKRLKYLCKIQTGNEDTQNANPEGKYPFYVRSPIVEHCDRYTFDGEGILVAGDGAGAGRIFHHVYGKYAVHQRVYRLSHFAGNADFIYYYLSNLFPHEMDKGSAQSTVPSMRLPMLLNFPLFLPSKKEQDKIVTFLDSRCSEIDAISADIQKEIEILEQYKRSVITEAVTKGLNPDVEMKDSGIEWVGNVPDHWGVLANKYVMKKRKDICTKWNGENVLSLTMNGVIVRDLDNPVGKMPTTFDGYQFVYSGNLLMCLFDYDVTPRCVGIVKNAGVTSPAYSRFELKENATLEYFYYYYLMIDFTKELLHLAKNLRHSFTEEQLGALKVPLPPLDEQKNIATYLDSKCKEIESVIASKKQQLEVLDSYKKSLIYEYVTGKKEVPMYES